MKLNFDSRGNLKPYIRSAISLDEFEAFFVNGFDYSNSRRLIFNEYHRFVADLKELLKESFVQWINGSFVSNKLNPGDMDFLTLLDFETFNKHQKAIEEKFTLWGARRHYQHLDAYTVKVFSESHPEGVLTKSDLLYWESWFGRTKPNRSKITFPKGFVQVQV